MFCNSPLNWFSIDKFSIGIIRTYPIAAVISKGLFHDKFLASEAKSDMNFRIAGEQTPHPDIVDARNGFNDARKLAIGYINVVNFKCLS